VRDGIQRLPTMRIPPAGTVFGAPVLEQFVDDRIEQLLWRIPRLLEVVVDLRRVDGGDRGVGVRVGGEDRALADGASALASARNCTPSRCGMR
jgi:hypothetical protein